MCGDIKKGSFYDKLTERYLEQYNVETVISGYLENVKSYFVKQKGAKDHLNQIIDQYLLDIQEKMPTQLNGTIIYRINLLKITKYMNVHDYNSTAELCERTVLLLEEQYKDHRTYIIIILNQWIISCTQLKQYDTASCLVHKALSYLSEGEYNWFKLQEYRAQLAFYQKDYTTAYQTYTKVIKHPNLYSLPKAIQEEWKLYEAYAQFVRLAGKVDHLPFPSRKFKVQRFINELYIFNNDKKGLNIAITIIHICYLLLYRRWNKMIDKMEGLEKYRQRHLQSRKHERSNLFTKMIVLLIRSDFNPHTARQRSAQLLKELRSIPLNVFTTDHEVEIIPYEHLWELLLGLLKQNPSTISQIQQKQ